MSPIKLLSIIATMIPGIIMVYGAKWFVNKYKLFERIKVPEDSTMNDIELSNYRLEKAVLNFKMLGMLLLLPGIILVLLYIR